MKVLQFKFHFVIIGFIAGVLSLLIGCRTSIEKNIQSEIDSIAARWVPDNREGICMVTSQIDKDGTIKLRGETTFPQAKQEIIKTLNNNGIVLIDSILLLPDTTKNDRFRGLVTLSVINLRKQPDHSSELVSQAILGTPVLILKDENDWLLVQTPDRYIAWTEKSSIQLMSNSELAVWKISDRVIYLGNSGWIYRFPDESEVVGDLVAGNILIKESESKGFTKVILPDRREGYVKNEMVKDFENWRTHVLCSEDNVIGVALTFLGLPYLWGGSSAKAVDCSGFVQSVYFMNGMILSRDASLQSAHGLAVDISNGYSNLKRGDLLFFGSKVNSTPHVTHVAIYKGDSEYIHSSGRVRINSLDSTRINYNGVRMNSMLAARRIIGSLNEKGIIPVIKHPWY